MKEHDFIWLEGDLTNLLLLLSGWDCQSKVVKHLAGTGSSWQGCQTTRKKMARPVSCLLVLLSGQLVVSFSFSALWLHCFTSHVLFVLLKTLFLPLFFLSDCIMLLMLCRLSFIYSSIPPTAGKYLIVFASSAFLTVWPKYDCVTIFLGGN